MKSLKAYPDLYSSMENCQIIRVYSMIYDKWWRPKLHGFWPKSELYVFFKQSIFKMNLMMKLTFKHLHKKWKRHFHQKNVAVQAHSSTVGNLGSVLLCHSLTHQLHTWCVQAGSSHINSVAVNFLKISVDQDVNSTFSHLVECSHSQDIIYWYQSF